MNVPRETVQSGGLAWEETDSALFIEMGRVMIPRRDEIERTIVTLLPVDDGTPFRGVDLAAGSGWLSRAILERYPQARMLLLDGTQTMLDEARSSLTPFEGRFETRLFQFENDGWIDELEGDIHCIVSSLALHHLNGAGKQRMFKRVFERLAPGGALLIADLVQPSSATALRLTANDWNHTVRLQSLELQGNTEIYDFFTSESWNIFEHPDPMDTPSNLFDQLGWLADTGFVGVDAFWVYAGHAVYGGYKPTPS